MARKGRAGAALAVSAVGSWVAGSVSVVFLMFFAPLLASDALQFGPPEYFSLMVLAFVVLATGSLLKGLFMTAFGLLLGCVGIDPVSRYQRFTFGLRELLDVSGFVSAVMGLFGCRDPDDCGEDFHRAGVTRVRFWERWPTVSK